MKEVNDMEEKEIYEFIVKEMERQNLSIEKLAELSGVNKDTVLRIESGEILSARVGTINRILNTLGYKLKIESINYVDGVSRDELCAEIIKIFGSGANFLDFIEDERYGVSFDCFVESDGENYIIDRETGEYINWYKFTHIGRCLNSRCNNITEFLTKFKNSEIKED
jgi:transcriptional regulator with XRE-family HTH domain